MLSIAVCDDEVIECCNMAKRIKEIMEEMKMPCIIRQFQSGRELLQALESFDIIFLDIIMQELDGMKTAQIFREKAFDKILIFISSSREYVFEAYDVEAFQYLLKPVDDRKLKRVLQKAVLKTEKCSQEIIIVSRERQKKKLFLDDIYYFEIKGRVVDVHGTEGTFTFSASFLSCLLLFFQHTMKRVSEPFLSEWETGVIDGVSYCFVILAVYQMSGHMEPVFCGKRKKWYVILALPLIMIITVFDVANWGASHGIMVRSGGSTGVYYDQIFSYAEFWVLTLLSMFAAGFYVFGMNRIYFEQEKSSQYHSQVAVYKMLTEQYRQSERLRHDMKNHVIALSALFQNKEWEKMGDYLKNMEGSGLEGGGDMTGNKAVDALLYQKRKRANEKNIKWECDVQMPKGYSINEFDLCVLFGNILDNALEACGRMRCGESCFINIQARTVKKCFLVEVRNSVDMTEKYEDGLTNKENPREHGIGLLNVSDVVHGYNGVLNIESEKGIFVTSVLIPLNDAAHDIKKAV